MAYQEILAAHPSIKSFWFTERVFTEADPLFQVMPDGYVELIFFFGATCTVKLDQDRSAPLYSPFAVGLLDKPLLFEIAGHIHIYAVRLHPWCAFPFLKISEGKDCMVLQNEVLGSLTKRLEEYHIDRQPAETLLLFKHYFVQHVMPLMQEDDFVSAIGQSIINQKNRLGKNLAAKHHTSLRTLQRRFLLRTGSTAKVFARKVRFEKVSHFIWLHPGCSFTDLAYEYGFADQAHFNREFKQFSGKTPGKFAKEALEAQQLLRAKNVAFIQFSQDKER